MRKLGKICLYALGSLIGLLLLLTLALKLALNRAPAYQAEIREWVHAQTGYHIAFAKVSPSFRWYGPELHFERLELRSKDDRRVLARAAGGRVAADIWQLVKTGKLLAGRIELNTPSITIARLGPTSFALAAEIKLGGGERSLDTLALDDLPAGKLAIRHAVVTMQNWNPTLPVLTLEEVNVDVRRGDRSLSAVIKARLPAALGGSINISTTLKGRGDFEVLSWDALVGARDVSFPGWRQLLPDYLSGLDAGVGAFDLAARGIGREPARADLEFAARGVVTRTPEGPAGRLDEIGGAISMTHAGDRWTLAGKHLHATRAGRREPDSEFAVSWRAAAAGALDLEGRASYVRADELLPLSGLVPDPGLRERLHEIAPSGQIEDASLTLARGEEAAPWRFTVRARFSDAGFGPVGKAPGLRGLTGSMAGTERGGRLQVESHGGVLNWPLQFLQPIPLTTLKSTVYWGRSEQGLLVASPEVALDIRNVPLRGKVAWRRPADGGLAELTLAAHFDNGNAAEARNYFPRALLKPPALLWLDRAFVAGRVKHADVVIRGPIRRFPFRDGSGLFLARCAVDGSTLDYANGWPRAENIDAEAEFHNEGMMARIHSGRINGVAVTSGEARFADFKTGELKLRLEGEGDAQDALAYLRATPLDAAAEHLFTEAQAHGPMQASIDLFLPLKDMPHRRVLVHGQLNGVSLNRAGSTLTATDLIGDFDVEGAQVARADVRGRLLGGGFTMQSRTPRGRPPTRTQLDFHGTLSGEALRAALELPDSIGIGGQTEWHAALRVAPEPSRERSLKIGSTLSGLSLRLPAPLDKEAEAPMASSLEILWPAGGGAQGQLALGSVLSGAYAFAPDASGMRLTHLVLNFGAGESAASDAQMLNVGGSVARLDLAGWLKLLPAGRGSRPLSSYLRSAKLNVTELDYLGLVFRDVSLQFAVAERGLRVTVGGPNVDGVITLPGGADSTEPWNLQFARLRFDLPDADAAAAAASAGGPNAPDAGGSLQGPADPRSVPSLEFHAAELVWGEHHFGDVRAKLVKVEDGVNLESISAKGASFAANAKGEWRGKDAGEARIIGAMTSTDVQATLRELGYVPVIEAREGRMDFDLGWSGAPSAAALAQAKGHLQLALDKGQVVGLNPGAGRVLGLTSVAALRRRLALDFSDLTDKGLAFDTVRGGFDLHDGSAYTDDLLVKGPAAEIGLIGRVGLKNKDYDQTAVVTGSVGNSLPLAALAGGPVVGAAVLLFTQVFKQPLKGLARGYYRITGSWDNPAVERIKSADAGAASAEAPK